jgi:hypothetical protein
VTLTCLLKRDSCFFGGITVSIALVCVAARKIERFLCILEDRKDGFLLRDLPSEKDSILTKSPENDHNALRNVWKASREQQGLMKILCNSLCRLIRRCKKYYGQNFLRSIWERACAVTL